MEDLKNECKWDGVAGYPIAEYETGKQKEMWQEEILQIRYSVHVTVDVTMELLFFINSSNICSTFSA